MDDRVSSSKAGSPGEGFDEAGQSSAGGRSSGGGGSSGGRPPKPESETRTVSHGLHLTESEKEKIKERADAADLSISEFLRRRALGKPIRPNVRRKRLRKLFDIGTSLREIEEKIGRQLITPEVEEKLHSVLNDLSSVLEPMVEEDHADGGEGGS